MANQIPNCPKPRDVNRQLTSKYEIKKPNLIMHIINLLENFIPISDRLKDTLNIVWGAEFKVKKREVLLKEGEVCNYMYYIVSGAIEIYYFSNEKKITKGFGFENELRTSAYSFLSRNPSNEYIEALEDSVLMKVHFTDIEKNYIEFPELERFGRFVAQQLYLMKEEREYSLLFRTAKERYELLLINEPQVCKRVSLGRIASYLGITQETLSRIRS